MSYQALIRIRFSTINSANNIISYANYDATALAVAASAQWIANFAITMTFPIMLANIGLAGAYGFYALSALISLFFVVKYIKETRGKTLESM
ncbi:putative orphan protein; putative membrane protein [Pseudoalteromonas translucida]|uniref:Orphan protein putative membrane protein n=1 Tax=Pseudoalteromonas translucida (strain TAC 125) TaxID=326442 RepID=Q3IIT9_PSET1|nr:putative orphan protein; putative membrane protein [Pseudoalteromonas translucida]